MSKILLGPILGYESSPTSSKNRYTVVVRVPAGLVPEWKVDGNVQAMKDISGKLHDGSRVWKGTVSLQPFETASVKKISYSIFQEGRPLANVCGDTKWSFVLPAKTTPKRQPRLAFCSCNGFSDPSALGSLEPLAMWSRMEKAHKKEPFSLLIMGGDQLYCDELARKEGSFARFWKWIAPGKRPKEKPSPQELTAAYMDHYLLAWSRLPYGDKIAPHTPMVNMMASIPSVMMWDDHDIFDGWGSYQTSPGQQPYYTEAFAAAKRAFEIYQLRGGSTNVSLLDRETSKLRNYSQAVSFGPFDILLLDTRTNRTPEQVMNGTQWEQLDAWLRFAVEKEDSSEKTLIVVTPIPVVYRRFHEWVSELPGEHGGEDDLRDHWSHSKHEGERNRLVAHLFAALGEKLYKRVTLISGDVHVGALGFLDNEDGREIAQVVSSGIIHPAPGVVAWAGLQALSGDEDHAIQGKPIIVAKMVRPIGAKDRYLRCRNFAWFKEGDDGKLWVNWECEVEKPTDTDQVYFGLR